MVTNTTAAMELVETGERRDRVGRKITPVGRREELVGAWQRSGLTQTEFARREGVNYSTFCWWVQQQRAKPETTEAAVPKLRFVEAALPSGGLAGLEVRLPDGTTVRGACVEAVATLVRALRS